TLPNPLTLWRKERNTPRRDLVRRRPSLRFVSQARGWRSGRLPSSLRSRAGNIRHMALEGFIFSCALRLRDGSPAQLRQTDALRGARQDMTFFVEVRPEAQPAFRGLLHLSGSSLSHLDACPGDNRAEKSMRVT